MYDLTNDEVLYKLNKKLNNANYDMMILQEECANLENINYETQTIEQIDNICACRTTTFERLDLIIDKVERLQKEIIETKFAFLFCSKSFKIPLFPRVLKTFCNQLGMEE